VARDPSLDASQAGRVRESERSALAAGAGVVVTSEATARIVMADYDVPSQRISVVRPGNDPVPPAPGRNDGVVRLLSVGSVVPVKGYDLLIAAVATLTATPCRLPGSRVPGRHPARGPPPGGRRAAGRRHRGARPRRQGRSSRRRAA